MTHHQHGAIIDPAVGTGHFLVETLDRMETADLVVLLSTQRVVLQQQVEAQAKEIADLTRERDEAQRSLAKIRRMIAQIRDL